MKCVKSQKKQYILRNNRKNTGKNLDLDREFSINIEDLNKVNSSWFKNYYNEKQ